MKYSCIYIYFQLLLEKKCDLNLCDEVNGNTPLMLATSLNMVEIKEFLKMEALITFYFSWTL